jgi:hypothetical protein
VRSDSNSQMRKIETTLENIMSCCRWIPLENAT